MPLDSTEDITAQPLDHSIELREYDARQGYEQSQWTETQLASPDLQDTRRYSRSILSNITDPFRDSQAELDDEQLSTLNLQKDRSNILGWRMGVVISLCTAGGVFIINFLFLVVAMAKFGQENGIGTLYQGDCTTVKHLDTAIHLVLNLLGVLILGATSYTTQCLSSPTRREIDTAHAKRKALDIGLPSAFNLRFMSWTKICLWFFLMLSTLPLHLL